MLANFVRFLYDPLSKVIFWPLREEGLRRLSPCLSVIYGEEIGRDAEIRTRDPLNPIQVRYQAAPRPDRNCVLRGLRFEEGEDLAGFLEGLLNPRAERL
jgi:hypothetical protein